MNGLRLSMYLLLIWVCPAFAAATLENPAPRALKSGVGLLSGWVCDAEELEVSFDGGARLFVPYGSDRTDTAGVCGDADNGFGLLWNYNELGDGPHTVTLYVDGVLTTQVNFSVATLGTNFLHGVTGQGTITLSDGKRVNVQWEETTQGFTITGYEEDEPPLPTERAGQFTGTWELTSGQVTQAYTFGTPEPCWVDVSGTGLSCVHDYAALAQLGPDTMTGYTTPYEYALVHQDGETCRAFFLHAPTDGVVEGDYGAATGSCQSSTVVVAIAQQVYSGNHPATGMRMQ